MRKLLILALLCLSRLSLANPAEQNCQADASGTTASCTLTAVVASHLIVVTMDTFNGGTPMTVTDTLTGVNLTVGPTSGAGCGWTSGNICLAGTAIVSH